MNKKALEIGLTARASSSSPGSTSATSRPPPTSRGCWSGGRNELIQHDHHHALATSSAARRGPHSHRQHQPPALRPLRVVGGKTGFINEAGYCFATWVRTQGRDLIAVVLGAPTNATRFADAVRLIQETANASIAQPRTESMTPPERRRALVSGLLAGARRRTVRRRRRDRDDPAADRLASGSRSTRPTARRSRSSGITALASVAVYASHGNVAWKTAAAVALGSASPRAGARGSRRGRRRPSSRARSRSSSSGGVRLLWSPAPPAAPW